MKRKEKDCYCFPDLSSLIVDGDLASKTFMTTFLNGYIYCVCYKFVIMDEIDQRFNDRSWCNCSHWLWMLSWLILQETPAAHMWWFQSRCVWRFSHVWCFLQPGKDSRLFPALVVSRLIFVPLLMMCNVQERSILPVLFPNDLVFAALMLLFSVSSGYCVCLSMTYAPQWVLKCYGEL